MADTALITTKSDPVFSPDARVGADGPLDSEASQEVLRKLDAWWNECRDLHAPNRAEQMVDADYHEGIQWSARDAATLLGRGQSADSHNFIQQMVNWVSGTERRTRVDWDVLPRNEEDVEMAPLKKELMKFQSDTNKAPWERSQAFEDCVKVGVGWTEEFVNLNRFESNVGIRCETWKNMWWDPFSINPVMKDCRYITRAKYIDLDYAAAMFPDRIDRIKTCAQSYLDPGLEMLQVDNTLPQVFWSTPLPNEYIADNFNYGAGSRNSRYARRRVLVLETWFKRPTAVQTIRDRASELDGALFDPSNPDHVQLTQGGKYSLTSQLTETMAVALWTPGALISLMRSPYKHGQFPFTPCFGYRSHRTYMPYGLVRNARVGQDEYNKRRSKAVWLLSVNRVIYESGAFDEADEDTMLDEASRPDGRVRVAAGALKDGRIKIEEGGKLEEEQVQLMESAKNNIFEQAGVTRENQGLETGSDMSGKAIIAKQTQGAVTTASIFDNYRLFMIQSGQKDLSNCEQFMTTPMQFRVLGESGAVKFVQLNQMMQDPTTGAVSFKNDITKNDCDFVIDQMDFRETVRQAQAAMLFDMLSKLPPQLMLPFMGEALKLTDLPNRMALVKIAQQVAGQPDPDAPPPDPNDPQVQAQQAAQQQQQQMAQAQLAEQQGKVQLLNSQAGHADAQADLARAQIPKAGAEAARTNAEVPLRQAQTAQTNAQAGHEAAKTNQTVVTTKHTALDVATQLAHATPLAPAADRIYQPNPPPGEVQADTDNAPGADLPVAPQPAAI